MGIAVTQKGHFYNKSNSAKATCTLAGAAAGGIYALGKADVIRQAAKDILVPEVVQNKGAFNQVAVKALKLLKSKPGMCGAAIGAAVALWIGSGIDGIVDYCRGKKADKMQK